MTTPLYVYKGSVEDDLLFAQLWAKMREDGDLALMFNDNDLPLSQFMRVIMPPSETFFRADETGIWFATWLEPFMGCAFQGLYIRNGRRGIAALVAFRRVLNLALQAYRTLVVTTQREELLPLYEAMGYYVLGRVPHLFYGNDAWVAYITQEDEDGDGTGTSDDDRGNLR